jgi:cytochrome c1
VDAVEPNGNINTYYGRIEEIWKLDYAHNFKAPLFRYQWVKMNRGVSVDKEYGMTIVDLNNIGYRNDPFVLAADVNQVFYVKDMSTKSKRGKHDKKKNQRAKASHSSYRGKETSRELKTSQTCQRIMKRMNESHPSVWPNTQTSCSLLRTLHGYGMIITKGITSRKNLPLCPLDIGSELKLIMCI